MLDLVSVYDWFVLYCSGICNSGLRLFVRGGAVQSVIYDMLVQTWQNCVARLYKEN